MKRQILPNYKTRLTAVVMLSAEVTALLGYAVPERVTEIGIPLLALFLWNKIDREVKNGNGKVGFLEGNW